VGDTGLELVALSDCYEKTCEDSGDLSSAKSGSLNDQSAIPADLAMVIDAWKHLSAKAKKDILGIVWQEEAEWSENTSPYIGEPAFHCLRGGPLLCDWKSAPATICVSGRP